MNAAALPLERRWGSRALVAALAVALAGCQTSGGAPGSGGSAGQQTASGTSLTPAEQQLRQDEERFRNTVMSGVAIGALGGAVIGALGAAVVGGNSKQVRNTAIAGAVIGGAAVGTDAYLTAKKEQAGRDNLRVTEAAAKDVQQDNVRLQAYLDTSKRVLAEGRNRLASLRSDVAAKRISADEARQAREREERNIASMNQTLQQARKTRDQYVEAAGKMNDSPQNKRDLDNEIKRMNSQIDQLQQNVSSYSQALQVSKA